MGTKGAMGQAFRAALYIWSLSMKKNTVFKGFLPLFIPIWLAANLLFLSRFPFVHTDEVWLASLSRTMFLKCSPGVTESFFDLVPRTPHAIRILYHFLQGMTISAAGFNIWGARLLSLLFGALCLFVFYRILEKWELNAMTGTLLLSVQIQFLYASRFGRQEIAILFFLLLSLNFLFSPRTGGFKKGLFTGLPIAAATGFHPNAFIAAWPPALILATLIILKKRRLKEALGFLSAAAAGGAFFTGLSLFLNRDFISDYGMRGKEAGFLAPLDVKLLGLDDFYRKLFFRISGTYYTPEIRPVFLLAALGLGLGLLHSIRHKKRKERLLFSLTSLAGINGGIILIGKYSPPSVVFQIPFLVILALAGVETFKGPVKYALCILIFAAFSGNSLRMIHEEIKQGGEPYTLFEENMARLIPANALTLGELTAGFHFEEGKLLDWRNLAMLRPLGMSFEDYVRERGVQYIILSADIKHIYQTRPVWNILYGNTSGYYRELEGFLEKDCVLTGEFESPGYGSRLVFRRGKAPWKVRIYRLKQVCKGTVQG